MLFHETPTALTTGTETIRVFGGLNPGWKVGETIRWPSKRGFGRVMRIVKAGPREIVVESVEEKKT